jgi:hypothetical protein
MMITALPNEPVLRLPTGPLLAISAGVPSLSGAVIAGAVMAIGRWDAGASYAALAGGGIIAIAAVVGILVMGPWRERPVGLWMTLWLAGTVVRMVVAPALTYLLYSATSLSPLALTLTVGFTYLVTLFAEAFYLAGYMNRTTTVAAAAGDPGTVEPREEQPPQW